jgi:hypothetical protein
MTMKRTKLIKTFDSDELFDEREFRHDIEINLNDFNRSVIEHSALWYKYGKLGRAGLMIEEKAKLRVEAMKKDLEAKLAEVSEQNRRDKKKSGESFTIDQIKNEAINSKVYRTAAENLRKLKEELIEIQYEVSILQLAEGIFSKRTNLLNTLGWSMSGERRSDVEIKHPQDRRSIEKDIEARKKVMEAKILENRRRKSHGR